MQAIERCWVEANRVEAEPMHARVDVHGGRQVPIALPQGDLGKVVEDGCESVRGHARGIVSVHRPGKDVDARLAEATRKVHSLGDGGNEKVRAAFLDQYLGDATGAETVAICLDNGTGARRDRGE